MQSTTFWGLNNALTIFCCSKLLWIHWKSCSFTNSLLLKFLSCNTRNRVVYTLKYGKNFSQRHECCRPTVEILKICKSAWFYWAAFQHTLQILLWDCILTETADVTMGLHSNRDCRPWNGATYQHTLQMLIWDYIPAQTAYLIMGLPSNTRYDLQIL